LSPAEAGGGGIFRLTTTRPVAVTMVFVTLFTFGWVSLQRLPMNLLPDISYPRVTVRAEYPGAAPEDVEERVTKRLHEALSVLPNLEAISSVSRAELVDVTLEFGWGTDLIDTVQSIRERLDRANLPLDVGSPLIMRFDPTLAPVMVIALTGGRDLVELRLLAEDRLAPAMSNVNKVAAVRVRGGLEDEIQVQLAPDRLDSYGLRPADIVGRIASENVNLASGTVLEGDTQYLVRILNEYKSPEEIANTILFRDGDSVVRLRDVATVRRTHKERDVITRKDGEVSVELLVHKEAGANIVDLAQRVRNAVFGTPEQRAWVDGLRSGEIDDPDEAMDAFLDGVAEDPLKAASMERIQAQRRADAEANSMVGDAKAEHDEADDDRSEEEKTLDEEQSQRLQELEQELITQDRSYEYLAADLPADVTVHLLSDQSRFIKSAIDEVRSSAMIGAVLSVLVLFLFLARIGTTLIIAVAIPVSVIVTFAALHWTDTSLNVMSLGGLALGIGMVVDNAIVVLESIARCREQGQRLAEAAVNGTREVAGAATASTLTTIAVFAPIIFVEGIAGQIFRDQALTVVASLAVSLLVALFLVPMLASRGRDRPPNADGSPAKSGLTFQSMLTPLRSGWAIVSMRMFTWEHLQSIWSKGGTARKLGLTLVSLPVLLPKFAFELCGRALVVVLVVAAFAVVLVLALTAGVFLAVMWLPSTLFRLVYGFLERIYPPFVAHLVRSPTGMGLVVLLSGALMYWTVQTSATLGSEMLPEVHQGEIICRLAMPVGTRLEDTDLMAQVAEQALRDDPRVAWISTTIGVPRNEISQPDEGEHSVRLMIGMAPAPEGRMEEREEAVMADLRDVLAELPQLRDSRFERPSLFTMRSPIVVEIKGQDLGMLAAAANDVTTELRSIPGLRDVRSSVQPGSPEIMLTFDRDLLSRYGLDTRRVADTVASMVKGDVATRFSDDEHKLDVLVQIDKKDLQSLDDLLSLPVNPRQDSSEPLSALTFSRVREGPREIRRIWGQRAAEVSASLSGFDVGRASAEIRRRMQSVERRHDAVITLGGQGREMEGALSQMLQALALAVFLVYVVMASIFESLLQPLIILLTVPLAMVGAMAALVAMDIPLSVVVFIGAIILAGIVVNNAIVLIDAINRRRRLDGMDLHEAVRTACAMRLRPILMTTMTTVLGLIPLTGLLPMTGGEGTELRAPMAITVVAGLSCATLLTLVVIPTIYVIVEGLIEKIRGSVKDTPAQGAEPAV
jgi:HAE1 family hydrophobic/amphiphilic exporter-1